VAGGPYEDIHVCVYTTSFRKVCERQHDCHGAEVEDVDWDLTDDHGGKCSNGLYYLCVKTQAQGQTHCYTKKVLILR